MIIRFLYVEFFVLESSTCCSLSFWRRCTTSSLQISANTVNRVLPPPPLPPLVPPPSFPSASSSFSSSSWVSLSLARSIFELWGWGRDQDELEESVKKLPSEMTVISILDKTHYSWGIVGVSILKKRVFAIYLRCVCRRGLVVMTIHSKW